MSTSWMQTFTGKQFELLVPMVENIDPIDIAVSLSRQCRFNGHTKEFYSVAEHSVRVANIVPSDAQPWALLHDAAEAYTGDIIQPMHHVTQYSLKSMERRIADAICERFNIKRNNKIDGSVKHADLRMLAMEAKALLPGGPICGWVDAMGPLDPVGIDGSLLGWHDDMACELFLMRGFNLGLWGELHTPI